MTQAHTHVFRLVQKEIPGRWAVQSASNSCRNRLVWIEAVDSSYLICRCGERRDV